MKITEKGSGKEITVDKDGSIGLLALGYAGLKAWKAARGRKIHVPEQQIKPGQPRKKVLLLGWDAAD